MFFVHREVIRKAARTKVKVTRTYARTTALSKQMSQAGRADLLGGLKTFKRNIPADRLFNAWKTGDYTNVMRNIPWHELPEHLERARTSIGGAYEKSAEFNIKSLPANTKRALRFDTKNPGIQKWLNSRTGDLIVNIQSDTQRVVQQAVKRSFDKALTPRQVANQIKNSIGLYPKQEQALANPTSGSLTLTPGIYYLSVQGNGTAAGALRVVATATFINVVSQVNAGTFGTLPAITPPTTFTAGQAPIMTVF